MIQLLKNIYLLDNKNIKKELEKLWLRYQAIIKKAKPSWVEINEARAILYMIGHIYPEHIGLESLEKRIKFIQPKITIDEFLSAVDAKDQEVLDKYKNNINFNKLKDFYLLIKSIKNRLHKGKLYLDEDIFNEKYQKLKPKNYF